MSCTRYVAVWSGSGRRFHGYPPACLSEWRERWPARGDAEMLRAGPNFGVGVGTLVLAIIPEDDG